jgi:uncharacterized RDD family membrane protein YckC
VNGGHDQPAHASTVPAEARPYQGHRAGVVTRLAANAVDLGVVIVLVVATYLVIAGIDFLIDPRSFHWPSLPLWGVSVIVLVVVPYLALSWCTTGRTFGDALFGLQVLNFRDRRMTAAGAFLRALLCMIFPIGVLWVAVNRHNRSVQDIILRTSVVYEWAPHAASTVQQPVSNA